MRVAFFSFRGMKYLGHMLAFGMLPLFMVACAWKSGFDGERAVSLGRVNTIHCGEVASKAPLVAGRIILDHHDLNEILFEDRDGLIDSINSFSRCRVVDELPEVMEEGVSYFRFLAKKVEVRQPFGRVVQVNGKPHTTDTTSCWSFASKVRLDGMEGIDTISFRLNARKPFFDSEALSYFRDLCTLR